MPRRPIPAHQRTTLRVPVEIHDGDAVRTETRSIDATFCSNSRTRTARADRAGHWRGMIDADIRVSLVYEVTYHIAISPNAFPDRLTDRKWIDHCLTRHDGRGVETRTRKFIKALSFGHLHIANVVKHHTGLHTIHD